MPDPTICDVEPFLYQSTPQIDGATGASGNQINEQYLEGYLNRLRESLCTDITAIIDECCGGGGGGAETFLELTDTPDSYTGEAGNIVAVKGDETGLEFISPLDEDGITLDYSTSEQTTNRTWIAGEPIYQKTIALGTLPNAAGTLVVNHNITNLLYIVKHDSWCYAPSTGQRLPIPFASTTLANNVQININATQITITVGINRSSFTTNYVTLFYTKS